MSITDLTAECTPRSDALMALRVKEQSGVGGVDVSMLEGQMSLLELMISSYLASGEGHPSRWEPLTDRCCLSSVSDADGKFHDRDRFTKTLENRPISGAGPH